MSSLRIFVVVILVGLIAGCSGTKNSSAASGNSAVASHPRAAAIANPCKLLTQQEASAVMGAPVRGPGELVHIQNVGARCRFFTKSEDELFLDATDDSLYDTYSHLGGVPVPGIGGDGAMWLHSQVGSYLYIKKDGNMITMGMPRTITTVTPAVIAAGKAIASGM
jgi:hypothetical protein